MLQDNLHLLKKIKRVEVSEALYDKIVQKILQDKAKIVPFYKAGIAASILFAMIFSQFLLVLKSAKMNESNIGKNINLVEINDNSLYYE